MLALNLMADNGPRRKRYQGRYEAQFRGHIFHGFVWYGVEAPDRLPFRRAFWWRIGKKLNTTNVRVLYDGVQFRNYENVQLEGDRHRRSE